MQEAAPKLKILFLCTGNSCRSQMAEGWTRRLKGERIDAWSAGVKATRLDLRAVQVMAEAGVDIAAQRAKHVSEVMHIAFDHVVTVCDNARESCPVFPGKARIVHHCFDDPPRLAREAKTDEEALAHYRRVRDEIRAFVETLPGALTRACAGEDARDVVRNAYAQIAAGERSGCCGAKASCCGSPQPETLAKGMGYSDDELAELPEGANMGLSCGNPTAIAALRPGETVLDLGSGAGFDSFIVAGKVGPTGRVIGVDMTAEMIARARRNAAAFAEESGLRNVEFRLGEIEHLPVADATIDVVISNCVINLSPDKPQVWREVARVLKPGGRVAVSDLALLKPLPPGLRESVEALVGCVAGAVLVDETRRMAEAAGLVNVQYAAHPEAIAAIEGASDPLYQAVRDLLPAGTRIGDYVTSIDVSAERPSA